MHLRHRADALLSAPRGRRHRLPSVTAHVGRLSLTLRYNRSGRLLGTNNLSRHVGSLGLGVLGLSWLRRSPGGGDRWGVERQHPRPAPALPSSPATSA
jgi:hypothetical protein